MMRTFVNIASLDDHRTVTTCEQILRHARGEISLTVVLQTDDDEHVSRVRSAAPEARVVVLPVQYARGPAFARALGASYYNGEDFYYQCDAHTFHPEGWDEMLAGWSAQLPEKHLLSCYIGFAPPGKEKLSYIEPTHWSHEGLHTSRREWDIHDAARPLKARFLGAGHVWAPGRFAVELPQDPCIFFLGEEQTLACRLWTSGWELYHPPGVAAFSSYTPECERLNDREGHENCGYLSGLGTQRVNSFFRRARRDDTRYMGPFGPGTERSFAEWVEWSGCDPEHGTVFPDSDWRARHGYE